MRRRSAAALLVASAALLALTAGAAAALLEPVTVTAEAPGTVTTGTQFGLEVAVEAEAGAFDIAAMPLTLGVKLAPECGGSLIGTPGSPVLERTLPNPVPGAAYVQKINAQVTAPGVGTDVLCAFVQDSQERQFATDTEAELKVVAPGGAGGAATTGAGAPTGLCSAARKDLTSAKRGLTRLKKRIRKVKRLRARAHGAHRRALGRKLSKLQAHKRRAARRRKVAVRQVAGACT